MFLHFLLFMQTRKDVGPGVTR